MYWSDWGQNPCIERADMDGGNRKRFLFGDMTWPNGLALDLENNRIYWSDGGNRTIEYANLDGTGRTTLIGNVLLQQLMLKWSKRQRTKRHTDGK